MSEQTLSRDQTKLAKLLKMSKRRPVKAYFFHTIFILCLIYILDEVSTNLPLILQTDILNAYFKIGENEYNLGNYTILTTICASTAFLTFFYKTLADKFGRKPFLVINSFGLAIALFLCFIGNLGFHIAGLLLINFFIPSDIQVVYILEMSSKKRRAFMLSLTKAIAYMGIALIPLIRLWVGTEGWNFSFLIPAIFGVIVGLIGMFTLRESPAFVQSKIQYYKRKIALGDNFDKAKMSKEEKENTAQGGIIAAFKYMLSHKSMLWLFLIVTIFSMCVVGANNFAVILNPGQSNATEQEIGLIYFIYPFAMAAIVLINGLIADLKGRKMAALFGGSFCFFGILCYVVACKAEWSPWVTGIFLGMFIGGYYSSIDTYNVISSEESPTNLRSSLLSIIGAATAIGSSAATGILVLFEKLVPRFDVGYFTLILTAPPLFVALLLLLTKMPETKNRSLSPTKNRFKAFFEKVMKPKQRKDNKDNNL